MRRFRIYAVSNFTLNKLFLATIFWMKEPCRSCPEKENDLGGCRCQAYMIAGDPAAADPVCDKSPEHYKIEAYIEQSQQPQPQLQLQLHQLSDSPLVFRDAKSSQKLDDDGVAF